MLDSLTVAEMINAALLLVTMFGVLAAFWQIRGGARAQRAAFLKDLYMQLRTDAEVRDAYYEIEYGKFVYDSNFHGSLLEPKVDRLLTLLDLVCEMHQRGILSDREMGFFEYQFGRVAKDTGIHEYLAFLSTFYESNEVAHKPFAAFQAWAENRRATNHYHRNQHERSLG